MRNYDLTAKEREALNCLISGLTMKETAEHMKVTPHTLRGHVRAVREKLGAATTAHAALIALHPELYAK